MNKRFIIIALIVIAAGATENQLAVKLGKKIKDTFGACFNGLHLCL